MRKWWHAGTAADPGTFGTVSPMTTNTAVGPAGVALAGLEKSFRTGQGVVPAVRGVNISIASGDTVTLLGPNGAGKSTTIDMLLGLLPPDAGTVSVFGTAPREAVKRGLIGAMLQVGSLIRDLSVRELVAMMAALYPNPLPVDEVLELTGATGFARQRTQRLSGGQTQRVRFAVALVSNPDLLVLDEPTAAVDVEGRQAFWQTMRGTRRRATSRSPVRGAGHLAGPRAHAGDDRAGDGWHHRPRGAARRRLGALGEQRVYAARRAGVALVLAGAGGAQRGNRYRMGSRRLGGERGMDRGLRAAGRPRVPPRHRSGVTSR